MAKSSQALQVLTPDPVVLLWQLFISLVVLVGGSLNVIIALISGNESDETSSILTKASDSVLSWFDSLDFSAEMVTFLFWAVLGSCVYFVLWAAASFITELYRDVSFAFSFIHPQSFNKSQHWAATASVNLLKVAAAILFIALIGFWIGSFMPFASDVATRAMREFDFLSALRLLLVVCASALALHAFVVLIRIFLLKTRIV